MKNVLLGVLIGLVIGSAPVLAQTPEDIRHTNTEIGIAIVATANYIIRQDNPYRTARDMSRCVDNPKKEEYAERAGRVFQDLTADFDEAMAVIRACGTNF